MNAWGMHLPYRSVPAMKTGRKGRDSWASASEKNPRASPIISVIPAWSNTRAKKNAPAPGSSVCDKGPWSDDADASSSSR